MAYIYLRDNTSLPMDIINEICSYLMPNLDDIVDLDTLCFDENYNNNKCEDCENTDSVVEDPLWCNSSRILCYSCKLYAYRDRDSKSSKTGSYKDTFRGLEYPKIIIEWLESLPYRNCYLYRRKLKTWGTDLWWFKDKKILRRIIKDSIKYAEQ